MNLEDDLEAFQETVMNTASAMFLGGFDTIVAAMLGFLFAMMTHPEAQRRAQKELDAVLSPGQLPSFKDRDSLPYLEALVKEVLRWKPITPMAAAHVLDVDDEYKGYFIPAGSLVLGNAWAILRDPELYPEPEAFRPERYLDIPEGKTAACPDPDITFGFGRRACPGRLMALDTLWLAFASILASYDISHVSDTNSAVPQYKPASSSLVFMPLPFPCLIKLRVSSETASGF